MGRGDQGAQGVQGIQGVQGEEGSSGGHGAAGEPGPAGPRGKPGFGSRRVTLSFSAVVALAVVLLGLFGCAVQQNRARIDDVKRQNAALKAQQAEQTTQNMTLRRQQKSLEALAAAGVQAHGALCAFRSNLYDQLVASRKFLADVQGHRRPPIQGISDQDIIASINRAKRTIRSLLGLRCK